MNNPSPSLSLSLCSTENCRLQQTPHLVCTTRHRGRQLCNDRSTLPRRHFYRHEPRRTSTHASQAVAAQAPTVVPAPTCPPTRHAHRPPPPTDPPQPAQCHCWMGNRMVRCRPTAASESEQVALCPATLCPIREVFMRAPAAAVAFQLPWPVRWPAATLPSVHPKRCSPRREHRRPTAPWVGQVAHSRRCSVWAARWWALSAAAALVTTRRWAPES